MTQSFKDKLKRKQPVDKVWNSGFGPKGDKPNPIKSVMDRVGQDVRETIYDIKDEPSEVPYRLRRRLRSYFTGRD